VNRREASAGTRVRFVGGSAASGQPYVHAGGQLPPILCALSPMRFDNLASTDPDVLRMQFSQDVWFYELVADDVGGGWRYHALYSVPAPVGETDSRTG
jgi:hypothetical protein